MPRTKGKKKGRARPAADEQGVSGLNPLRAGMPAPDSIVGVKRMERGGKVYRIIKTVEHDEYDEPEAPRRGRARKRSERK